MKMGPRLFPDFTFLKYLQNLAKGRKVPYIFICLHQYLVNLLHLWQYNVFLLPFCYFTCFSFTLLKLCIKDSFSKVIEVKSCFKKSVQSLPRVWKICDKGLIKHVRIGYVMNMILYLCVKFGSQML